MTVCAKDRRCLFGTVVGADVLIGPRVRLSCMGQSVHGLLSRMPQIDKFVVMPNHLHMIVCLADGPMGTSAPTGGVPSLVRYLKGQITRQWGGSVWQRSYYDHIIRDENDYLRIWNYIDTNPARWAEDKYYIAQES